MSILIAGQRACFTATSCVSSTGCVVMRSAICAARMHLL